MSIADLLNKKWVRNPISAEKKEKKVVDKPESKWHKIGLAIEEHEHYDTFKRIAGEKLVKKLIEGITSDHEEECDEYYRYLVEMEERIEQEEEQEKRMKHESKLQSATKRLRPE